MYAPQANPAELIHPRKRGEYEYLNLLQMAATDGERKKNRTGIDTFYLPGGMLKFDLRNGFPAITTKRLAWKAVVAELLCFLRGRTSARDFRVEGTKIWDANANENQAWLSNPNRKGTDDLGRIYGAQWTDWRAHGRTINQVANAVETLTSDPDNRRVIITAWNPGELDQMALPPCHVLYQFTANKELGFLDLCLYQRSADMFLGVPFNIASASLFLSLMARKVGLQPRFFTHFLADVHVYENHLEPVQEQLSRVPYPAPSLAISDISVPNTGTKLVSAWASTDDFRLAEYQHHPAIKADMAV